VSPGVQPRFGVSTWPLAFDLPQVFEEPDGLKLRVVRSVATADMTSMAGLVKAPARGVPRCLEDFDPASLLTRSRRSKP
jgi:antitoxin PrlF